MKYINTQKQYIRMWFEFYRMALIDDDLNKILSDQNYSINHGAM